MKLKKSNYIAILDRLDFKKDNLDYVDIDVNTISVETIPYQDKINLIIDFNTMMKELIKLCEKNFLSYKEHLILGEYRVRNLNIFYDYVSSNMNLKEVGDKYNISRTRAEQIFNKISRYFRNRYRFSYP